MPDVESEGGVPSTFRTDRAETVDAFYRLLFPAEGESYLPLVFVCAPPLSGKSALCDLLHNHIVRHQPDAHVARILANEMGSDETLPEFFESQYDCTFQEFCAYTGDQVVLIDEAQMTYEDAVFWKGYVKNTVKSRIPCLRLVLFCSYACRSAQRSVIASMIPAQSTFGLRAEDSKPSLQLSRTELDQIIGGSIGATVSDLVWILSSGHIGVARGILRFLHKKCGTKRAGSVTAEDMETVLRSVQLVDYFESSYRGFPSSGNLQKAVNAHSDSDEMTIMSLKEVLDDVASGKRVPPYDGKETTRRKAVELLTMHGFLFEDSNNSLQFASNMHQKVWLHFSRADSTFSKK